MARYRVEAWSRTSIHARERICTARITLSARDAYDAAHELARMMRLTANQWNDGAPSPQVVIRVEEQ